MSSAPGASASIVRVMSVPDGVVRGVEMVTVPLTVFPDSRYRLVGDVESNPWLFVARMVKFPPGPPVFKEKGKENGVPADRMLFESA